MLDFVVSCDTAVLLSNVHHSPPSTETYESLRQSISLLYCLSCWVSMSHVRALAVKTSVDEVSADIVPLLNQWPLKVWEQASLSHWVQARSEPRRVTGVLSSLLKTRSHGCGSEALLRLTSTPGFHHKADSSHMPLSSHHKNGNKQPNLAVIPLTFSCFFFFFFLEEYFTAQPASRWLKWQQSAIWQINRSPKQ